MDCALPGGKANTPVRAAPPAISPTRAPQHTSAGADPSLIRNTESTAAPRSSPVGSDRPQGGGGASPTLAALTPTLRAKQSSSRAASPQQRSAACAPQVGPGGPAGAPKQLL